MLFNSLIFLGFVIIVFLVYQRLSHRRQNVFLILASYTFYGCWDWRFIFLLLGLTVINFIIGQYLGEFIKQRRRKRIVILATVINIGVLGFFKYFNFFIDSAATLLSAVGLHPNLPLLQVILPVGISFYTFQIMTYTIDIYNGKLKPTKNFIDFALFVSFFPQLLAGPISRATSLLPQIATPRQITKAQVLTGLNLILLGYFKKVAIADSLAPLVDKIFASPELMTSGQLWTGYYAYAIQVYCDFSGYTDIARGIATILGFSLAENFNAPYLSRSITEVWRRWHISLSTWLRDYLFIPLGGTRKGVIRSCINLMITFLLCGIWHGAAWTYVIWGLAHGFWLSCHRIVLKGKKVDLSWPTTFRGRIVGVFKIILTFHVFSLISVIFRSSNLSNMLTYFEGLFRFRQFTGIDSSVIFAGSLMLMLDLLYMGLKSHTWLTDRHEYSTIRRAITLLLIISVLAAAIAHTATVTPFVYFQY